MTIISNEVKIDIEIKHIIITPNTSGRRSMELKYQSA
jgi:hypothetical protein